MRHIVALFIVTAAIAGLAGALTVAKLSGSAGAAPPLQQREDQIAISLGDISANASGSYTQHSKSAVLALDHGDYPSSTTFRLEVVAEVPSDNSISCFRLFDKTDPAADFPVEGSEICLTALGETVRVRSGVFTLPATEREYELQSVLGSGGNAATLWAARIVAEWTERAR